MKYYYNYLTTLIKATTCLYLGYQLISKHYEFSRINKAISNINRQADSNIIPFKKNLSWKERYYVSELKCIIPSLLLMGLAFYRPNISGASHYVNSMDKNVGYFLIGFALRSKERFPGWTTILCCATSIFLINQIEVNTSFVDKTQNRKYYCGEQSLYSVLPISSETLLTIPNSLIYNIEECQVYFCSSIRGNQHATLERIDEDRIRAKYKSNGVAIGVFDNTGSYQV